MRFTMLLLSALILAGCSNNDEATKIQDGKALYGMYCATCHQDDGKGKFLRGIPSNYNTQLNLAQVASLIREGHANKKDMPTFPQLTSPQAHSIAAYLKYRMKQ